jgi:hypothetical protein
VLLGALTFLRIGSFLNSSQAVAKAGQLDPSGTGANDLKTVLAQTKASANAIKKSNLFVPGAARQYPVNEVLGILGHEALIGDKWYKVGDSVGEARILAIEPTKVKIVWNGQEKEFSPIGATGSGPGGKPDRTALAGRKSGAGAPGKVVATGSRRGPGSGLSEQGKEQRRQQWANISPEERQRLRDEMRQRSGRRGQ